MRRQNLLLLITLMASGAVNAVAQNSSAPPAASAASTDKPATKVWTNDDVSTLPMSATGSTTVTSSSKPAKPAPKPAPSKGKSLQWYRQQINMLQAQIPPLDSQIADLQSALDGKPTGDGKVSQRPRAVKEDDWSVELAQLRTKRDGILSKIEDLRDEARHNGIPDRQLP